MLRWALLVAYPLLAHLSILTDSRELTGTALIVLIVGLLLPALRSGKRRAWLLLAGGVAGTTALCAAGDGLWLMVALSMALPCVVLGAFLLSLRDGCTPLITEMAARLHDTELPAEIVHYTRRLTQLWAGVIALLMVYELALILFGTPRAWSRYANGYAYAILAAVFVVEYAYRRVRFRALPQPSLARYLRQLAARDRVDVRHRPAL
ncbi:MAG TPA: hypothetical protein VFQ88_08240 [Nevskiaceae bacterium]|nr:hypothetical protein [Nevskiaceae bacterium]